MLPQFQFQFQFIYLFMLKLILILCDYNPCLMSREKYKQYLQTLIIHQLRLEYLKHGKSYKSFYALKKDQIINQLLDLHQKKYATEESKKQSVVVQQEVLGNTRGQRKGTGINLKLSEFGLRQFENRIKRLRTKAISFQVNTFMSQPPPLMTQDGSDPDFIGKLNAFISNYPSFSWTNRLFLTKDQLKFNPNSLLSSHIFESSNLQAQLHQNAENIKNEVQYCTFLTQYYRQCFTYVHNTPRSYSPSPGTILDKFTQLSNKIITLKSQRFRLQSQQPFLSLLSQIQQGNLENHAQYFSRMQETASSRYKLYERALKYQSISTVYLFMLLLYQYYARKSLSLNTIQMVLHFMRIVVDGSSIWITEGKLSSPSPSPKEIEIIHKTHAIMMKFIILFKDVLGGRLYLTEGQLLTYVNSLSIMGGIMDKYRQFAKSGYLELEQIMRKAGMEGYQLNELFQLMDQNIRQNIFQSIGFLGDSLSVSSIQQYSNIFLKVYELIGKENISKKESISLIKLMMKAIEEGSIYSHSQNNPMQNPLIVSKYSVYFSEKIRSIINEDIKRWKLSQFQLIERKETL